jgi:hypothetical protein
MTPKIFADGLRPPLGPVRRYLQSAHDARLVDDSVVAGHDPTVAPQYFCFRAWVPVTEEQVIAYATAWDLLVPEPHSFSCSSMGYSSVGPTSLGFHRRCWRRQHYSTEAVLSRLTFARPTCTGDTTIGTTVICST